MARLLKPVRTIVKWYAHLGINLSRLRLLCIWIRRNALAALAGIIMAPIWGLRPHVGVDAVIPAFLIIVLGGVGSFGGAVSCRRTGRADRRYHGRLCIAVVVDVDVSIADRRDNSFRARGLFGKKSVLEN